MSPASAVIFSVLSPSVKLITSLSFTLKVVFKDGGWQKGASADGYTTYTNDTNGRTVTVEIKDEVTQPM